MTRKPSRFCAWTALLLVITLLLGRSLAEAGERGVWAQAKSSIVRFSRQAGTFLQEAHRAFRKFFRHDAPQAGREIGRGAVKTGKETHQALKAAGKETGRALKRSALEAKRNLKNAPKEIREGSEGSR
ncbi:MAG: hypothetical protein V1878_00795 [bacterium]